MGTVMAAPADMQPDIFFRDAGPSVVQRLDPDRGVFAVIGKGDVRQAVPAIGQIGGVDLQQEAGIDDRLVFLVHDIGDGEHELFVALVVWFASQCSIVPGGLAGRNASARRPSMPP